ncbi:MAG: translation initiation factor Sui1 [Steroidobacteraceae bacterium]|jgi:translation initiation factor 1|nr:translation initiation factor Sui1 [Steroidobacteraceae bacterium]
MTAYPDRPGSRVVYSTGVGRVCPACRRPAERCECRGSKASAPPRDGIVRVGRQTQGRAGKGVTVVTGVPLGATELEQLAKALKQRCGSGGTVRDGTIEIQGEHRDTLVAELTKRGYTVKRSGG